LRISRGAAHNDKVKFRQSRTAKDNDEMCRPSKGTEIKGCARGILKKAFCYFIERF
jgi:hypothetical protein